ncbi:MAG: rod-binding protein [Lachnospiraceae bacterium]|mgnify:CR=1 FL=1|nr:rod-binding protein [Lachnospiraceae bacterium]
MDISSGVSSAYSSYFASQASSKLDSRIQNRDYGQSSDEELLSACKEFESYFLEQIFKEMQKTVDVFKEEGSDPNENLVEFFRGNAIQDLAATSTETQGLGLAQMLFEQMKRNYNL